MSFRRLQRRLKDMCFFIPLTVGEEYGGMHCITPKPCDIMNHQTLSYDRIVL